MIRPKVSVIVPVYKTDTYLSQCLESILSQTLKEVEVIVVDEGDMDRCRTIIDYYEAQDPRLKGIHTQNGGYGASVNKGIELATGEYIGIVESDDFIEPEMYEEMYNYAKSLDVDVVKTPYYEYSDGKSFKRICNYRAYITESCPKNKAFSIIDFPQLMAVHASLWAGIYRAEYMNERRVRFINAKGAGYVDVAFRIDTLACADKIAWLHKPYYNYRVTNEDSSTNNFNLSGMLQRWTEVHEKYGSPDSGYEYWGRYSILDEYLNTLGWAFLMPVTKDQQKQMEYNFSFVSDSLVKDSKALSSRQKSHICQFKTNPKKLMQKAKRFRFFRSIRSPIERFLDKSTNPVLLFWLLCGFIITILLDDSLKSGTLQVYSSTIITNALEVLVGLFTACLTVSFVFKALNIGKNAIKNIIASTRSKEKWSELQRFEQHIEVKHVPFKGTLKKCGFKLGEDG